MNHTNEEARAIWADQDSMPDVLNQEPQSECTADDFDVVLSAPAWVWNQEQAILDFLASGGELYERYFPKFGRSFFVAMRQTNVIGYGETPLEAILSWAHQVKH
jgi:hypothetical protein